MCAPRSHSDNSNNRLAMFGFCLFWQKDPELAELQSKAGSLKKSIHDFQRDKENFRRQEAWYRLKSLKEPDWKGNADVALEIQDQIDKKIVKSAQELSAVEQRLQERQEELKGMRARSLALRKKTCLPDTTAR